MAGIDLSKPSLKLAARRDANVEFAVASVYHLPVADNSVDLLINCFSPLAIDEFLRVLKPGGVFLYAVPGAEHLKELKQVLYDSPYLNKEEDIPYPGFIYEEVSSVKAAIWVDGQEDLQCLFRMTPYFWKTPRTGTSRLALLDELKVTTSVRVHAFRKE